MRPEHKKAFFETADELNCWIGLREPNEHSNAYIGRWGFTAKDEHCKAKSADNPRHPFKGLVVNPEVCPGAFKDKDSLNLAREKWTLFVAGKPQHYSWDRDGLVKFRGKAIHADFDLMYVNKADGAGKMAFTSYQEQKQLTKKAAAMLNKLLHAKMILHGAELGWKGDKKSGVFVGARASEKILSFGPKGQFREDTSYMSTDPAKMQ